MNLQLLEDTAVLSFVGEIVEERLRHGHKMCSADRVDGKSRVAIPNAKAWMTGCVPF